MMRSILHKINTWLINYLRQPGDFKEIVLHKKIWWLINFTGFFILSMTIIFVPDTEYGEKKDISDLVFLLAMPVLLIGFHFYRKGIEDWALFSQIFLVGITSFKVYIMGGLLLAGAPIFIGLLGPVYALILPNKKRAIFVCILYIVLMIGATLLQPEPPENLSVPLYINGYLIGISMIFMVLYYFTSQVDKLKRQEKQRMAELDEFKTKFYTHITHEFRTPLTVISGMVDQVKNNPEKWFNEGLKMIKRNNLKLLNLTNQMLELSKLEAKVLPVNMVQDDLAVYLKYLVESFDSFAKSRDINLNFSVLPKKIRMDFDPEKIQNILSNLISNAIKFTPAAGHVDVTVFEELKKRESQLILSIKDTGSGIPAKDLPHVFDRYYQANQSENQFEEGTGLGLALTRELVKLLKGDISVESEPGKGATFRVALPITHLAPVGKISISKEIQLSEMYSDETEPILPSETDSAQDKLVLLLVEDNKDVLKYLHSILSDQYKIEIAENGQEGFEKATEIIPDLVISDVMMPVLDGFEFCKKLKSDIRTSHIPVVMLTARADADSKLEGLNVGADVYLAKPFDKKELLLRVQKLIELRKALQERYKSLVPLRSSFETSDATTFKREDNFIQKVRTALEERLSDGDFDISKLCQSLTMSRSQLYRKFNALTNTTVNQFIFNIRLHKAKELLLTTEFNITEIAFETGFKSVSHFSRAFSEEFGMSPSKARND